MILDVLFTISMVSMFVGALGLLRFPDVYNRLHASTMISVGGTMFALIILAIKSWALDWRVTVKLLLLVFFMVCTSPTGSHMIANAAYASGVKPVGVKNRAPV